MTARPRTDRDIANGDRQRGVAKRAIAAAADMLEDAADLREIRRRLSDLEARERIPWEQVKRDLGL